MGNQCCGSRDLNYPEEGGFMKKDFVTIKTSNIIRDYIIDKCIGYG